MRWIIEWAQRSNEHAVHNARGAATVLSAARVEREEIALFLASYAARRADSIRSA